MPVRLPRMTLPRMIGVDGPPMQIAEPSNQDTSLPSIVGAAPTRCRSRQLVRVRTRIALSRMIARLDGPTISERGREVVALDGGRAGMDDDMGVRRAVGDEAARVAGDAEEVAQPVGAPCQAAIERSGDRLDGGSTALDDDRDRLDGVHGWSGW